MRFNGSVQKFKTIKFAFLTKKSKKQMRDLKTIGCVSLSKLLEVPLKVSIRLSFPRTRLQVLCLPRLGAAIQKRYACMALFWILSSAVELVN